MERSKEIKWMDMEWNYSMNLISGNKAARIKYLAFFITLNLAIYSGLFVANGRSSQEISLVLSLILFILNIALYLLYIRSHSAENDNMEQIKRIRKNLLKENDITSMSDSHWLLFNGRFKGSDKWSIWGGKWGYKIVLSVLSLFVCLSYLIMIGRWETDINTLLANCFNSFFLPFLFIYMSLSLLLVRFGLDMVNNYNLD